MTYTYEKGLGKNHPVQADSKKYLEQLFRIIWHSRFKGIVQLDGGFVYPREELRRIIKHLRYIKNEN